MEDVLLWIFCEADTKVELEILRFAGGVGGYLQDKRERKQDKQEGNLTSVKKDGLNKSFSWQCSSVEVLARLLRRNGQALGRTPCLVISWV